MLSWVLILALCGPIFARPDSLPLGRDDQYMHPQSKPLDKTRASAINPDENTAAYWKKHAQESVTDRLKLTLNTNIAKNVILFLGDGMSIPTISAARVYIGGEEAHLSFDKFPHTGLSKTYCVDHQVADSACSATAYLGGVKGNKGTVGVTGSVIPNDCVAMANTSNHVLSIAKWSQLEGKRTGLVTTARVTHASPAGVYAHTAQRDWESDTDVLKANEDPNICQDIAYQLVYGETGSNLNVALGGGRGELLPKVVNDEEGIPGRRSDGVNLINQWKVNKKNLNQAAEYIWNREGLQNVFEETDFLLGLFDEDHIKYNLKRNKTFTPSLEEMTEAAIKTLDKSDKGYFLFVEGARIDMAHHKNWARKSLDETSEFSKAIQKAVDITNEEDTLIVVTSDHAHTMSYSGYPERGNDILGIGGEADDGLPYATLTYANGPGYRKEHGKGDRHDISKDDLSDIEYKYPALSPLDSETHGGDDVAIFALGPWSHLFAGVMEENVVPHLMAYASCVGDGVTACDS